MQLLSLGLAIVEVCEVISILFLELKPRAEHSLRSRPTTTYR